MTVVRDYGVPILIGGIAPSPTDDAVAVRSVLASNPVLPATATMVNANSGNQANANAIAAMPAVAGKTNYLTGFMVTAAGSTAGLVVNITITGLLGGTITLTFVFPAGVLIGATPIIYSLPFPLPASAPNTAITLTLPAGGLGNTNAAVNIQGFVV